MEKDNKKTDSLAVDSVSAGSLIAKLEDQVESCNRKASQVKGHPASVSYETMHKERASAFQYCLDEIKILSENSETTRKF